jgi:hypothetical protein
VAGTDVPADPVGDVIAEVDTLRAAGYRTVAEADGFVLLNR